MRFMMGTAEGDFDAIADLVHDDFVMDWPQSGERFSGRANAFGAMRAQRDRPEPAGPPRLVGSGDTWVLMMPLRYSDDLSLHRRARAGGWPHQARDRPWAARFRRRLTEPSSPTVVSGPDGSELLVGPFAPGSISIMSWWMPSRSRMARYRSGSNASVPSTPAPAHTPSARSSMATTGLKPVCHATGPGRARASSPAHRTSGTGRPRAAGRPWADDPRAHDRPAAHVVAERRRVGHERRDHVARRDLDALDPHLVVPVEAHAVERLELPDELVPRAYLKVTRLTAGSQRGTRSTSSCSTWTHSTGADALREDELSRLRERLGREPVAVLPDDGGLRHSSMVVQMENTVANP